MRLEELQRVTLQFQEAVNLDADELEAWLRTEESQSVGFRPDGSYSMRHLPVGHDEPLRAELIAFLDAVRSGATPAVTGDEGVASLEIAIRCLESPARPAAVPETSNATS